MHVSILVARDIVGGARMFVLSGRRDEDHYTRLPRDSAAV